MPQSERRILFALAEPGYFRMYGPAITEMTRRGWDVSLVFEKPNRRGPAVSFPASAGGRVQTLGASPGGVSTAAATLRVGLDYFRYLEPAFAEAGYLRRRVEKYLPRTLRFLTRIDHLPRWVISAAIAAGRVAERVIPVSRATVEFVRHARPDIILVTPVVAFGQTGVRQTELVKAARALHLPVIVGVASWDHLTSKGLVRIVPDALFVWNDTQVREAEQLHRVPTSRVVVTGAQPLDHWFEPASTTAVDTFRCSLGIDDHRRVLLVVGSSPRMAPGDSEVRFVQCWLAALRASANAELREAFVIVRPHPGNTAPWRQVDLGDPQAIIHPRTYASFPLPDTDIETFRCSLAASTAVIGVNTTAMIEAAILRKPVLTIRDAAFAHSQQQTLHFAYLARDRGGFALTADTLSEHVAQLEHLFTHGADLEMVDRFVERFVRPLGMQRPATAHLCDAIERLATVRARSASHAVHGQPAVSQHTR